jgi:cytidine deaminase
MEKMNKQLVDKLYKMALEARNNAYVPYSKFKVGAALLTEDGEVYTGANVENVSYGLSMCAERNAIFKANIDGKRKYKALMVVADTKGPISPCGACRQVMTEFGDYKVYLSNLEGEIKETTSFELLPYNFDKEDMDEK